MRAKIKAIRSKRHKKLFLFLAVCLLCSLGGGLCVLEAQAQTAEAVIIDHSSTDLTQVPQNWIEQAKSSLHIGYGHTSHGSQLTSGMSGLVNFSNGNFEFADNLFQYNHNSNSGGLYLHYFEGDGYGTGDLDHDAGYYPAWVNETRSYLGTPDPVTGKGQSHPEMNVIMWSWCGQASSRTEQTMLDTYLLPMSELEEDYPGVTFVYMTGHSDGTGESGNLHQRNQQIRQYCQENGKVLYDFYDIELYDPDGNYYGDKLVNDNCDYDSDGNGSRDSNYATAWQNSHVQNQDWYSVSCAHSQALNCNRKAYAAWHLFARLAGWDGTGASGQTCGDGACNGSETCSNCENDCGICQTTYGLSDFVALLANWLTAGTTQTDINQDGIVNVRDLGIMMSNWE